MMKSLHLTSLIVAVALAGTGAQAQSLARHPYPQNMQSDSVEILWKTDLPCESWVEVSEAQGSSKVTYHCSAPATSHQVRVPQLKPDTKYLYRVGAGEGKFLTPAPYSFQTFPKDNLTSFSFIAFGDHRTYPDKHRAVVEAILKRCQKMGFPRFVLDSGDYTGAGESPTDLWDPQFFTPEQGLIENVCVFPVIGNHECPPTQPRIPHHYLENFDVPTSSSGTEYYYSFDFANAHFCMIDAYATDFTTGSKQYEWIKQDLETSTKPWKFAVMHFPPFIHRIAPKVSYGNMEERETLVPLFERYGVSAVFSGDSHFYQRSEVNGIHYICTGGGGAPLYFPGNGMPYVRASARVNHYSWIDIQGDKMKLEVYDTDNKLIDSLNATCRNQMK